MRDLAHRRMISDEDCGSLVTSTYYGGSQPSRPLKKEDVPSSSTPLDTLRSKSNGQDKQGERNDSHYHVVLGHLYSISTTVLALFGVAWFFILAGESVTLVVW